MQQRILEPQELERFESVQWTQSYRCNKRGDVSPNSTRFRQNMTNLFQSNTLKTLTISTHGDSKDVLPEIERIGIRNAERLVIEPDGIRSTLYLIPLSGMKDIRFHFHHELDQIAPNGTTHHPIHWLWNIPKLESCHLRVTINSDSEFIENALRWWDTESSGKRQISKSWRYWRCYWIHREWTVSPFLCIIFAHYIPIWNHWPLDFWGAVCVQRQELFSKSAKMNNVLWMQNVEMLLAEHPSMPASWVCIFSLFLSFDCIHRICPSV